MSRGGGERKRGVGERGKVEGGEEERREGSEERERNLLMRGRCDSCDFWRWVWDEMRASGVK